MIPIPTKGFTLVETLVATAILSIAIIGPMYAIQQGVVSSYTARDRLVASGLAQEGVEFVRAVRDNNYLYTIANPGSTRSWFFGLDGSGGSANCTVSAGCAVDMYYNTVLACSGTCPELRVLSSGIYNHGAASASNQNSGFTRTIRLTRINAHEMKVSVTVEWYTAKVPYRIEVTEHIQDWL